MVNEGLLSWRGCSLRCAIDDVAGSSLRLRLRDGRRQDRLRRNRAAEAVMGPGTRMISNLGCECTNQLQVFGIESLQALRLQRTNVVPLYVDCDKFFQINERG